MSNRIKNLALCAGVLFGFCILLELFLRSYGVDSRIFISKLSRKRYIQTHAREFMSIARSAEVTGVSKDTFNIYFLGESTMWGVPFGPELSVPNAVDYRLGASLGGRPVRIVNLSSAAKDAVYARYIVELLFRRKDVFHPSLIVFYGGHNQFLKFHPTDPDVLPRGIGWLAERSELVRQLLVLISKSTGPILEIDQRHFFDRPPFPFDRHGYDKVIANYKEQILQMVMSAKENNVPIILSNMVGNYVDWEPNRSVFCNSGQNKEQKQRFAELFREGQAFEKQGNYDGALAAYQKAKAICDQFAELYFRQGKVYEAQGEYEKAWDAFQKTDDKDVFPSYAVSAQNDFIQSLDRFDHVYVVDALSYFRKHSKDGLLDEDLIIDNIHPNLEGYLLLSEVIAEKIHSLFASGGGPLKPLDIETAKKFFHLDDSKMFEVYYQTGRWTTRLATWHYDPENRLEIADYFFRKAVEINPAKIEGYLGLAVTALLRKNNVQAEEFLQKARTLNLEGTEEYLRNPWIHKIIRRANAK